MRKLFITLLYLSTIALSVASEPSCYKSFREDISQKLREFLKSQNVEFYANDFNAEFVFRPSENGPMLDPTPSFAIFPEIYTKSQISQIKRAYFRFSKKYRSHVTMGKNFKIYVTDNFPCNKDEYTYDVDVPDCLTHDDVFRNNDPEEDLSRWYRDNFSRVFNVSLYISETSLTENGLHRAKATLLINGKTPPKDVLKEIKWKACSLNGSNCKKLEGGTNAFYSYGASKFMIIAEFSPLKQKYISKKIINQDKTYRLSIRELAKSKEGIELHVALYNFYGKDVTATVGHNKLKVYKSLEGDDVLNLQKISTHKWLLSKDKLELNNKIMAEFANNESDLIKSINVKYNVYRVDSMEVASKEEGFRKFKVNLMKADLPFDSNFTFKVSCVSGFDDCSVSQVDATHFNAKNSFKNYDVLITVNYQNNIIELTKEIVSKNQLNLSLSNATYSNGEGSCIGSISLNSKTIDLESVIKLGFMPKWNNEKCSNDKTTCKIPNEFDNDKVKDNTLKLSLYKDNKELFSDECVVKGSTKPGFSLTVEQDAYEKHGVEYDQCSSVITLTQKGKEDKILSTAEMRNHDLSIKWKEVESASCSSLRCSLKSDEPQIEVSAELFKSNKKVQSSTCTLGLSEDKEEVGRFDDLEITYRPLPKRIIQQPPRRMIVTPMVY